MAKTGFVPCFSRYRYGDSDYPIECIFSDSVQLERAKKLFSALLESESQLDLKQHIGQEIKPMRPNQSGEMDRVLRKINFPEGTPVRIDYGSNKFRIILGLTTDPDKGKIAYVFMVSNSHKDFMPGKQRLK